MPASFLTSDKVVLSGMTPLMMFSAVLVPPRKKFLMPVTAVKVELMMTGSVTDAA